MTGSLQVADERHAPGPWAAEGVILSDRRGNYATYYDPRFADEWTLQNYPTADLSALDFEVYGTTGDLEAPVLEGAGSVSTKRATAGDKVTFTIRASDEGTGLRGASLWLVNRDTGDTLTVSLDAAEDGTMTGSLQVADERHAPGPWAAEGVILSDRRGNYATYYDPRFADEWTLQNYPTADLSALDFEVYGTTGDTEAPVLIGAVGVTVRQVMPGESVTMMLRTEGHDVSRAWITYRTPETGSEHDVELDRRTADGIMSGTMEITPQTEVGVWEALSVNVVDSNGVEKSVTNSALGARAMALSLSAEEASARSGDDILSQDSADLSALTFEVTPFESQVAGQFWDTPADAWYVTEGWLDYVVSNGIISGYAYADGTPQGEFGPDDPLTRGQLAVILYRYAHPGSTDTVDPGDFADWSAFPDVPAHAYYTAAINWCAARPASSPAYDSGPDAGRFLPDRAVTRAELATMVWRFAASYLGVDVSGADPSAFESLPDHADIYPFAVEAMVWCADEGLMTRRHPRWHGLPGRSGHRHPRPGREGRHRAGARRRGPRPSPPPAPGLADPSSRIHVSPHGSRGFGWRPLCGPFLFGLATVASNTRGRWCKIAPRTGGGPCRRVGRAGGWAVPQPVETRRSLGSGHWPGPRTLRREVVRWSVV